MASNSNGGGSYTAATGNSTPEDAVYYKRLRGEDLTAAEWKIYRENFDDPSKPSGYVDYGVAPF